jgi:serine/threonine protein kinase
LARYVFKQILAGLQHMNSLGLSHRDLKSENVFVTDDFVMKLGDFGMVTPRNETDTRTGTEAYMPPEVLRGETYHPEKADIFCCGVMLFILVARHPPFGRATSTDPHYKLVLANRWDLFWKFHSRSKEDGLDFWGKELIDLISLMLMPDATMRPSIAEVLTHPWFEGETMSKSEVESDFSDR